MIVQKIEEKGLLFLKLATLGGPFVIFVETYIFSDWNYLIGLLLLVTLDTLGGAIAAWLEDKYSALKLYKKLGIKAASITIALACVGILKKTSIDGNPPMWAGYIDSFFYGALILLEALSVLKKWFKITHNETIGMIIHYLDGIREKHIDKYGKQDKNNKD